MHASREMTAHGILVNAEVTAEARLLRCSDGSKRDCESYAINRSDVSLAMASSRTM